MAFSKTEAAFDYVLSQFVPYMAFLLFIIVSILALGALAVFFDGPLKARYQKSLIDCPDDASIQEAAEHVQLLATTPILTPPPPLKASDHLHDNKHHLLLAATGSVASIKIPLIVSALAHHPNLSIRLLFTSSAQSFLQAQSAEQPALQSLLQISNVDAIYTDADEWRKPWVREDPILHIELRRWADLMVLAPLSANSLAKISLGIADNLVTSVVRAWDTTGLMDAERKNVIDAVGSGGVQSKRARKGIIVAPAMNTAMWEHPVTKRHVAVLEEEWNVRHGGWVEVLAPVEKELACGDSGNGAMRDWREVVTAIEGRLGLDGVGKESGEVAG